MIRVAVLGACGKLGSEVVRTISEAPDLELVGACDVARVGERIADVASAPKAEGVIVGDLAEMLSKSKPQVLIDVAKPYRLANTKLAMQQGVVPVTGATGQTKEDLAEIERFAEATGTGAMVIPNFAIGAVLMMKFAAEAAKYMPDVEIVELHREQKADAPSGTSIKTAEVIDQARKAAEVEAAKPVGAEDDPARGEIRSGVHVHSVRLPGLVAHQEVLFGGAGQLLTIRHDSLDWTSFMPGVLLAVRRATNIQGLVYGLDKLL